MAGLEFHFGDSGNAGQLFRGRDLLIAIFGDPNNRGLETAPSGD